MYQYAFLSLSRDYAYIVLSIAAAFLFPRVFSGSWFWIMPDVVALVVFYHLRFSAAIFGIIAAWISGLILDIWRQDLLGQNALMFALIAFLWQSWQRRSRRPSQHILLQGWIVALAAIVHKLSDALLHHHLVSLFSWANVIAIFTGGLLCAIIWWIVENFKHVDDFPDKFHKFY